MSSHGAAASSSTISSTGISPLYSASAAQQVEPRRMELSLNEEDGSLQTAPLSQVLLAATDALYSDLYNMAQGEIDVICSSAALPQGDEAAAATAAAAAMMDEEGVEQVVMDPATVQRKTERMSNLSFAQRRHELSWRLSSHGKCLQQVAALTAAAACGTDILRHAVQVSTTAMQHTRTAWVQADEAQDALYFFHAQQLFSARAAPHDVYGAGDVLLRGAWYDLPRDLLLQTDRYESCSVERTWSRQETDQRWQLAVRDKLITGEVGWMRRTLQQQQQQQQPPHDDSIQHQHPLWKVSLKGGIVKFTVGKPKSVAATTSNDTTTSAAAAATTWQYPVEALLTVLPSQQQHAATAWTLLSINVHVQAKTGEFNHQLETSNRQRYDLHRLAATAMSREEVRCSNHQKHATAERILSKLLLGSSSSSSAAILLDATATTTTTTTDATILNGGGNPPNIEPPPAPARPLHALFHVAHTFLLAWQLELLSAQAQAMRRGVWAAAGDANPPVTVTPVRFSEHGDGGVLSISFWKVDDSYGPPAMGDLRLLLADDDADDDNIASPAVVEASSGAVPKRGALATTTTTTSQLTLSIRAESNAGIKVSLSGGDSMMNVTGKRRQLIQSTTQDLLEAASNPFVLSASDALLAATKLCAEFKCQAVVEALQPTAAGRKSILPTWIRLSVDRGSIAVGARVQYHGVPEDTSSGMPILFQVMCDARTGSFVIAFSRSMQLLRRLAGNDIQASEAMSLRVASLPLNRRRAAGSNSSGRVVRDAFDSLIRSMNLIGQRAGVGGKWDDIDDKSSSLRERAILTACADVKTALIKCCGMAALYGLAPLALGAAVGLEAIPDM